MIKPIKVFDTVVICCFEGAHSKHSTFISFQLGTLSFDLVITVGSEEICEQRGSRGTSLICRVETGFMLIKMGTKKEAESKRKKKKDVDVQRFIFRDVLGNRRIRSLPLALVRLWHVPKGGTMEMTDPSFIQVLHLALMTNRLTNCHVDASYLSVGGSR
jgi:hypothetical protein